MKKRSNNEGSIYFDKRSGKWLSVVIIGTDAKGNPKRRQKSAATKTEAIANLKALHIKQLSPCAFEGITFGAWLDIWLKKYKIGNVKTSSVERYRYGITRIKNQGDLAHRKIENIKAVHIEAHLASTKEKPCEYNFRLLIIKAAFVKAVENEIIGKSPAQYITGTRYEREELNVLTDDELKRIVEATEKEDYRLSLAVKIGFLTGLRREEIFALRASDINFDGATLSVRRACFIVKGREEVGALKTKKSRREISLPKKLVSEIRLYIMREGLRGDDYFFADGERIHVATYAKRLERVGKRMGIKATFRGLRHYHATYLFSKGVSAKDIQERLGHKSIKTTLDIYTHFVKGNDENIATILECCL